MTCPACHSDTAPGARFCEACGHEVNPGMPAAPVPEAADTASPLDSVRVVPPAAPCAACGGVVAEDGYCQTCGMPAVKPRDHFQEQPAPWVAGVCDRGIRHPRNEDAMALAADAAPASRALLVVCDGVSSSTDSDRASLAAARATREVLAGSRPRGAGTVAARVAATAGLLESAVAAANAAVVETTTATRGDNPAACTWVAAVLDAELLVVGWVGDSRAYWLPDAGAATALTVDDSWAAEQIAQGMPRREAEEGTHAHAITRWLGVDAPDPAPRHVSRELDGPGWVLVCSDGLWNYCSEAEDLAALVRRCAAVGSPSLAPVGTGGTAPEPDPGADPLALAEELVAWANAQGGHDNITVALARVGSP
ncbi:PP2C family serine/threonine-protein phosphatase [Oryzihumus sp.]|uniref:PP2C family serine/threonine-protein phosphatase n=1 Tax=Oryzihumus sp. TaxID=1968903 RepID=UPI002ED9646B